MTFYLRNDGFSMGFDSGQMMMNTLPIVEMPNVRFLDCVRKLGENVRLACHAFDDFYEDSDFGFFVLSARRKFEIKKMLEATYAYDKKELLGKSYMAMINRKKVQHVRIVVMNDGYDLRKMAVKLNIKRGTLFTHEQLGAEKFLNRRLVVQTCLTEVFAEEEMFQRYFPKYIADRYTPKQVCDKIDEVLGLNFNRKILFHYDKEMKEYKTETIGQMIYAMMLEREKRSVKAKFDNINIRLMLLLLVTIAFGTEDEILAYMTEMYKWLVLESCDSCLEKVLFAGRGDQEILYNLAAFGSELRPFCLRKVRVAYTIYDHKKEVPVSPYVIKRLSHGFFTISGMYDRAEVTFMIQNDYICVSKINVGQALMLREVIGRIVRAARAITFGHDDILLQWYKDIFIKTGTFKYIDECINDLIYLLPQMPEMANCFKNLVLCLYYAKVPYSVIKTVILSGTARNFDLVTASLLNSNARDVGGVIDYLFGKCTNEIMIYEFLSSDNRVIPLKGLCGF